jgi:UDP-glucose 4-epimerase
MTAAREMGLGSKKNVESRRAGKGLPEPADGIKYNGQRNLFDMKKKHVIAGGAGFIGLNLARHLLRDQQSQVVILDNHSNSHPKELKLLQIEQQSTGQLKSIKVDISDYQSLCSIVDDIDAKEFAVDGGSTVWHLAANSDIPSGISNPAIDLRDTFMTTYNLLRLCKERGVKKFIFASSSAIYGDHGETVIKEDTAPLMPISNYGAMKLASEAICFAAKHDFLEDLYVFRFPNVVGTPATHGVIYDFVKKLKRDPSQLTVLGDGTQKKSYLHVNDLIRAMTYLSETVDFKDETPIFNLGPSQDSITVREIAECVKANTSPNAVIRYGEVSYGWKGDIPRFSYNIDKALSHGWQPKLDSRAAIELAVKQITEAQN